MVRVSLNRFFAQKAGNEPDDYEDAFAPKVSGPIQADSIALAVSDGAGETSFAKEWAKMLARSFAKEPFTTKDTLQVQTELLAKRWQSIVNRRPLPWFAEEKVRLGAFAALLGVQFYSGINASSESGQLSAVAVGDSCLFQIRNDQLVLSFPLQRSADFNNSPILLSSNLARNARVWEGVKLQSAEWKVGDTFLLATDALACWFLSEHERNERPWNILVGFSEDPMPSHSFELWTKATRSTLQMKNDDTTCLLSRF